MTNCASLSAIEGVLGRGESPGQTELVPPGRGQAITGQGIEALARWEEKLPRYKLPSQKSGAKPKPKPQTKTNHQKRQFPLSELI